ncbi:MAG: glycosyltransferase family 2 protein [Prochlorotrichaceae cyanobacterium]
MTIGLLVLAFLFLGERIGKYWLIQRFFAKNFLPPQDLVSKNNLVPEKPKVSILQPILSGDPTLWDCLSGNLEMKSHCEREFLWLIDDDDLGAQRGCPELIEKYPEVNIKLISLPPAQDEVSPKTFKLIEGLKEAEGNIIAVLDDDTILPDYGLDQCILFLNQPEIGIAFGLPYYINFSNIWSSLVSCVVNGNSLLTYIPYSTIIEPFTINGMFFAMKKEILDQVNGFSGLETAIVDDFAIAQHFRSQGYKLAQTPVCHGISTQIENPSHYLSLLTRWFVFPQESIMKSVKIKELIVFYSMAFIPTLAPLIIIVFIILFPSIYTLAYGFVYFNINLYILIQFNLRYLNHATPNHKIPLLSIVQILLPLHILLALLSPRKINWRGHIMQLKKDGRFQFIQRRTETKT